MIASWENPECHFGDHYWVGGTCRDCGNFNAGLLNWLRQEKAEKEGRHHGDHFHLTIATADKCKHKDHDGGSCADKDGCLHHEASDTFLASLPEDPRYDAADHWLEPSAATKAESAAGA